MDTVQASLKEILIKGFISNELELERAFVLERKLRLMGKENPELKDDRATLRQIIKKYEDSVWSSQEKVDNTKMQESDLAEFIAENERQFIQRRKNIIKEHLSNHQLTQQDLGKLLGHSKSYMSELMNGISPFSMKDLILIHRLFQIKLDDLVLLTVSSEEILRLKKTIIEMKKPELRLGKKDLESVLG